MIFDPLFGWIGVGVVVAILLALCIIPLVRGDGPRWKWCARIGVVALLGLALARPGFPVESTTEEYEAAADAYFLVDTTTSMAAEDYDGDGTRLDGVKDDMLELAKQLPGARLSIITFASTASTAMPLTTDHAAFASAVDVLSPEMSQNSNGSSITEAGDELEERMSANAEDRPDNQTLVFYFGDGEQTAQGSPDSWSSFASRIDSGAVFGYGTSQGGRMKESQPFGYGPGSGQDGTGQGGTEEYIRDAQGNPGISRIDEGNLQQIASDLGLPYHLRDASTPLASVYTAPTYDQRLVQKDGRLTVDEYFWVPLILVFAWIAVEMVFGVRELIRVRSVMPPRRGGRRANAAPPFPGGPGTGAAGWGGPGPGGAGPGGTPARTQPEPVNGGRS
ncbi:MULTISPECIES: VWA domain-containing protein [unclassified Brevibacterium]|uniref:vWA domain-containing protein n=1 Tax=unclassified Brevibacterium TaxID=2614124 RepID=UPI0010F567F8|nr:MULTISPECIES: VWA domain-containing protein [unclassified Brevibacterium]MCM1011757.1 VWA domain-containing protein [Brevibacterium sp. XM4083]